MLVQVYNVTVRGLMKRLLFLFATIARGLRDQLSGAGFHGRLLRFADRARRSEPPTLMRHLLLRSLAALACLGVFSLPQNSAAPQPDQADRPNFSGIWTLDLKASTSVEPLMKQIGASLLEQKCAASIRLKATVHQTEHVLTVATRGLGFAL
jgi:hypothetical protein